MYISIGSVSGVPSDTLEHLSHLVSFINMMLKLFLGAVLCSAAFAATCESEGGQCKRNCAGGEWDFSLTCDNNRRMCCFDETSTPVEPTTSRPPAASVDPSTIPGQENCGVSFTNRIVSGQDANEHEWPWQISLWHKSYDMHICGGTLVTDQYVITAAHCVVGSNYDQPRYFKVVLGEHHQEENSGTEVEREVLEIIVHEGYVDRAPWPHDIALLKLSAPVDLGTRYVKTACIPQSSDEFTAADDCWITGWGDSKGTANELILQEIKANIRTNADCAAAWGSKSILDSHLCNSDGSSGSCSGDSGGPLQCSRNGRYNLVGVVSWGTSDCTSPGYPGVYTRVTSYTNWIYDKLMSHYSQKKASRYD